MEDGDRMGYRCGVDSYYKGIDALVSLPEEQLLYQDLQGLATGEHPGSVARLPLFWYN